MKFDVLTQLLSVTISRSEHHSLPQLLTHAPCNFTKSCEGTEEDLTVG